MFVWIYIIVFLALVIAYSIVKLVDENCCNHDWEVIEYDDHNGKNLVQCRECKVCDVKKDRELDK